MLNEDRPKLRRQPVDRPVGYVAHEGSLARPVRTQQPVPAEPFVPKGTSKTDKTRMSARAKTPVLYGTLAAEHHTWQDTIKSKVTSELPWV